MKLIPPGGGIKHLRSSWGSSKPVNEFVRKAKADAVNAEGQY